METRFSWEVTVDFRWRYTDDNGYDVAGPELSFADQADAEDWVGQQWRELLELGVSQVTLLHDEAEVYGPMSLRPAS